MAFPHPAHDDSDALIEGLVEAFARELREQDPSGKALARLEDVGLAGAEAARFLLDTSAQWDEHLGGFYDTATVKRVLGAPGRPVSKQAVSKRRGLLALRTGSGRVVYPRFQFVGGRPVTGLAEVLAALPKATVSRWTLASWLVSETPELDGERPIDVLAEGQVDVVVKLARAWAASLAA